jgi:undecaprenyl-diphosphatase
LLWIAVGLVGASLALFLLIAEDVLDGGGLISRDEAVLRWFVDQRSESMIKVARVVSTLGGFVSLLCVGLALALWLWRREWHLAVAPTVSLLLAGLASTAAKSVFGRARPPIAVHEVHVASPAFPSGHATDAAGFFLAAAFVLAITVVHHARTQVVLVALGMLLAGLVGLSRLVLAVHWLSDVVAGWALGTAIAITVVTSLWYLATRSQRPDSAPPTRPRA